ncbi:hypothetical protein [Bacillus taeanensis]|uniref:Uncharacterized protein n=1 Tax=Bacillus taeanensis TaxID=273032 RepID=A0A366XS56_9BACI|nr:hypothetical protein [Bacillus taeanensis]RBW69210.1 hypothetical protein DS031_12580 [Bacillus taeanensis]
MHDRDNIDNPIQRTLLLDLHEILLGLNGECQTDQVFYNFINELKLFNSSDMEQLANTVYEALRKNDAF